MRWQAGRRSTNVEDIRDEEVPRRVPRGMQPGGGSILLILVVSLLTGQNLLQLLVMLDADADGQILDDVVRIGTGLLGKFFGGKQ